MVITLEELKVIAGEKGFNVVLLEKDYLLTELLFLIKDVEGIYFKGGTALNKIFLNHARLSEDLDFTLVGKLSDVEGKIRERLRGTIFDRVTHDKRVDKFVRLVVHYKLFHEGGTIFIDLNERASLLKNPEKHVVPHFYKDYIASFSVNTLAMDEMVGEKIAATIGRNKPRDHFDVYSLILRKIPLDLVIAERKCVLSGYEFSVINMFNQAKKLNNRWDEDLLPLLAKKVSFKEVILVLAKHFRLKEEKDKLKKK